jgi:hypothetical protein
MVFFYVYSVTIQTARNVRNDYYYCTSREDLSRSAGSALLTYISRAEARDDSPNLS